MASAETQIEEIFGSLAKGSAASFGQLLLEDTSEADRPAKQHKGNAGAGNGLGKRPRPFSNGSSRGGNNPQNQRGSRSQDHSGHIPLVKAMGRLLLRQETQLQILKQNSAWLVFLKPGQEGPMALLHRTAEAYRETSQSRLMEAPLRAILLSTLFQALLTCLQNMVAGGCWLFVVDCWLLVVVVVVAGVVGIIAVIVVDVCGSSAFC